MTAATNPSAAGSPLSRFRGNPTGAATAKAPAPAAPPKFVREHLQTPATSRMLEYAATMYAKISLAIPPSIKIPVELLSATDAMESAWQSGDFDEFADATTKYTVAIWHWFSETPEGKEFQRQRTGGRA